MVKMVARQASNLGIMHFHKGTLRGMAMVRIRADTPIIKHKQLLPHTTKDNKDINHIHDDNFVAGAYWPHI